MPEEHKRKISEAFRRKNLHPPMNGRKYCTTCCIYKEYISFSKDRSRNDGYDRRCLECAARYLKILRERDTVSNRKYFENRTIWMRKWINSPGEKKKQKARKLVRQALLNKELIKMPCGVCESPDVHAHHDDYSKPLEVKWLCPLHHKRLHRRKALVATKRL